MQNQPDYFVIMKDAREYGRSADVDMNMLWSDVLDVVHEAASEGDTICFVHHIHDNCVEDRTQEALDATLNFLADYGEPLTYEQMAWVEDTFGLDTARHFRSTA